MVWYPSDAIRRESIGCTSNVLALDRESGQPCRRMEGHQRLLVKWVAPARRKVFEVDKRGEFLPIFSWPHRRGCRI